MAASTPAKRIVRKADPAKPTVRKSPVMSTGAVKAAGKSNPGVVLDLDALSKDQAFPGLKMPKVPFTFLLGGVTYELADPRDSDWKMALELSGNPFWLMRTALVGADDPIDDPTEAETKNCKERLGLDASKEASDVTELVQDGKVSGEDVVPEVDVVPALIDRFTTAYLPGWKLNALFQNWHEQYKIDLSGGKGILGALLGTPE
jgi:hypothetical protein